MSIVRRFPLSAGLVTALLTTTALKRRSRFSGGQLERYVSTNLDNLRVTPVRALVGSALVLQDDAWLVPTAAAGFAVGALEYRVGAARTAEIGVAGHVLPTLVTQAGGLVGHSPGLATGVRTVPFRHGRLLHRGGRGRGGCRNPPRAGPLDPDDMRRHGRRRRSGRDSRRRRDRTPARARRRLVLRS